MRTVWLVVLAVACSEYDVKAEADGATPADTATTPAAPGVLRVTPAEIDVGLREVDTTTDEVILIENVGESPLGLTGAGLVDETGMFTLAAVPLDPLGPGESRGVAVSYTPTAFGEHAASAWFEPGDRSPIQQVVLRGHTGEPDITVDPTVYDFGIVEVSSEHHLDITVRNDGEAPLTISSIRYESTDTDVLWVDRDGDLEDGQVLDVGSSSTVKIAFTPTETGAWEGTLSVLSDDPDEPEAPSQHRGIAEQICECPDGYTPRTDKTGCEKREFVPALFVGTPWEACAIEPYFAYGMLGARYPGGLRVESSFWGMNDGVANGRLNDVGIWGCVEGTEVAGHDPVGEWVGFQVCLTLEETGSYLAGMAADNRFFITVDGEEIWRDETAATSAFNYWWMLPITLDEGEHIVELWGYNDHSIAAFGAEISGPFPPAGMVDDPTMAALDYEGNIVWSTADAIGHAFEIGGAGWYCPDEGMVLDLCQDEPTCVLSDSEPCL